MPIAGKKPKILCIDDRAENLKVRTMMLEQFGCETISAADHDSSIKIIRETPVDLLLIDYHLAKGETGEAIAREVRAIHPEIPLIMLTGDAKLPESAKECVDAVLIKGASNPRELLETIEELLPNVELMPRREMLVQEPKRRKAS